MSGDADLYFRARDGGAQVFRVIHDAKDGRLRLEPLATISLNADAVRPQGDREISAAEQTTISTWMDERRATLKAREIDDVARTLEAMQRTAHWVQGKASDDALAQVEDDLLMAAHDLRLAIVKRKADRIDDAD